MICLKIVLNMYILLNGKVGLLRQLSPSLLNSSCLKIGRCAYEIKALHELCLIYITFYVELIDW